MPSDAKVTDGLLELDTYNHVRERRKALLALSEQYGRAVVRSKWKELKRTLGMQIKAVNGLAEPASRLTKAQQESLGLRDLVVSCKRIEQMLKGALARIATVLDRGGY